MAKVSPFLWFVGNMQEAVNFYVSVFKDARVVEMSPMSARFELLGREFLALNAHPHQPFTEAISFFVEVETQEEIDYYWERLGEGGDPAAQICGWLKDKFGVSWQIVPHEVYKLYEDADSPGARAAMEALMKMKKIDIAALQEAYDNAEAAGVKH